MVIAVGLDMMMVILIISRKGARAATMTVGIFGIAKPRLTEGIFNGMIPKRMAKKLPRRIAKKLPKRIVKVFRCERLMEIP